MLPGRNITDAEMRLAEDQFAQVAAETYIAPFDGWQMKQEAKASLAAWHRSRIQAVEIPLADGALSISDVPAVVLDGISSEFRHIAGLTALSGPSPFKEAS